MMSHDKYGRHAHVHVCKKPSSIFSGTGGPISMKLGMYLGPKDSDAFINHDAEITLTFLQGQYRSPMHLNWENC